jgi:protein-S-isoprenylcysteine O-methyltransferase Ste14
VPRAVAERFGEVGPKEPLVAGVSIVFGLVVATFATLEFARAGGTPEPLDPPPRLVTTGIYAHFRHPIAWAEASFVIAALALRPSVWVGIYTLGFVIALFGPLRIREERALARRYGATYAAWRAG